MDSSTEKSRKYRTLDTLERIGNRLPDPAALFVIGLLLVMLISHLASIFNWSVVNSANEQVIVARSLLSSEGIWWLLSHLVQNFINFPPLGIVLVGMLGIGLADRSGLLPVALQLASMRVKGIWLTPAMIFLGIMSSIALDAGYVVLPPIAAVLFILAKRSPVVGIAAVFAGVSAGFGANLFITSLDPLLAGFTQAGASLLDPNYRVAVTSNWGFMFASTFLLTAVGWFVTARYVEPRFSYKHDAVSAKQLARLNEITSEKKAALKYALFSLTSLLILIVVCV